MKPLNKKSKLKNRKRAFADGGSIAGLGARAAEGTQRSSKTASGTALPVIPGNIQDYLNKVLAEGSNEDLVQNAGLTEDQLTAFDQIRGMAGEDGVSGQGLSYALGLLGPNGGVNQGDISAFMDPYAQSVVNPAVRAFQDAGANSLNQQRDRALQSGSFGGSRDALLQGNIISDTNQGVFDLTNRGLSDAFRYGTDTAFKSKGLGLQGANDAQRLGLNSATSLLQVGNQQQQQNQNVTDLPLKNNQYFANLLSSLAPMQIGQAQQSAGETNSFASSSPAQGSRLGQILGAGAGLYSLFGGDDQTGASGGGSSRRNGASFFNAGDLSFGSGEGFDYGSFGKGPTNYADGGPIKGYGLGGFLSGGTSANPQGIDGIDLGIGGGNQNQGNSSNSSSVDMSLLSDLMAQQSQQSQQGQGKKKIKVNVKGGMKGAAAGAKMGSAILPGWGTAVGAVVGGLAGAFFKKGGPVGLGSRHPNTTESLENLSGLLSNLETSKSGGLQGYADGGLVQTQEDLEQLLRASEEQEGLGEILRHMGDFGGTFKKDISKVKEVFDKGRMGARSIGNAAQELSFGEILRRMGDFGGTFKKDISKVKEVFDREFGSGRDSRLQGRANEASQRVQEEAARELEGRMGARSIGNAAQELSFMDAFREGRGGEYLQGLRNRPQEENNGIRSEQETDLMSRLDRELALQRKQKPHAVSQSELFDLGPFGNLTNQPGDRSMDDVRQSSGMIEQNQGNNQKKGDFLDRINLPLMMAGLAMMGSKEDFFGQVADGGLAGINTMLQSRALQTQALKDAQAAGFKEREVSATELTAQSGVVAANADWISKVQKSAKVDTTVINAAITAASKIVETAIASGNVDTLEQQSKLFQESFTRYVKAAEGAGANVRIVEAPGTTPTGEISTLNQIMLGSK